MFSPSVVFPQTATVHLHKDRRHFSCPYCHRIHQHPPPDWLMEYYTIGYGYYDFGVWFPIAGGDGLGIVKVDGNGRRYTVLWSEDNPRPQEGD